MDGHDENIRSVFENLAKLKPKLLKNANGEQV